MFQVDFASRRPIYEQIVNNIIQLTSVGVIKSGDKLPPVRTLAAQIGINPNTVAKAYRILEGDGYIFSAVGKGSFVTDKLQNSSKQLVTIEDYKKAAKKAYLFGVEKISLVKILDDIYNGGDTID